MSRPGARPSRLAKQAQTRRKLLEAAHRVFAADGFSRANLGGIAEAAGFSKGAIYSNFASKEAIALEVLQQLVDAELLALEHVADTFTGRPADVFAALAAAYAARSAAPHASLLGVELLLLARHDARLREPVAAIYSARNSAKLALVVRLADAMGVRLRGEPAVVADIIAALGHGHAALTHGGAELSSLGAMMENLLPMLLEAH